MLSIVPVVTEAEKRAFYRFSWRLYRDDPCWVPHAWPRWKAYLDRQSAFFRHGEGEFWVARENGCLLGTIGTAIDHARNRHRGESSAVFGFFEVAPGRYDAASALWDHARGWAREKGMARVEGPRSFGPHEGHGFLVDGFQSPPAALMAHTPPFYAEFAERYGWEAERECVAYRVDLRPYRNGIDRLPGIARRAASRAAGRLGSGVVRAASALRWDEEVDRLHDIYNRSQASLADFSPADLGDFREQAHELRRVIDPDLALLAEVDGRTVGFLLAVPDFGAALRRARGLYHLWGYLRLALERRRIRGLSFKILGVDPEYRCRGVDAILYLELVRRALRKRYTWMDLSLTTTDNAQTARIAGKFGAEVYRRYREYRIRA